MIIIVIIIPIDALSKQLLGGRHFEAIKRAAGRDYCFNTETLACQGAIPGLTDQAGAQE
jgi:hypothetical protein